MSLKTSIGKLAGGLARHLPLPRGRDRLALIATALGGAPKQIDTVRTKGGLLLHIDSEVFFYRHAFFTGVYEPGISRLLASIVRPGQLCIDVGANIGWHAVAMAGLVGPLGRVYAFEPLPETYKLLMQNSERNGLSDILHPHMHAVSASDGEATMYVEPSLPRTHASLRGNSHVEGTPVMTVALDHYEDGALIGKVDLMKIDVEGAERQAIAGSASILRAKQPPSLIIEAALSTSERFGYTPNELLDDLEEFNDFLFFIIDERSGRLQHFKRFESGHIGANILCVPHTRQELIHRLKRARLLV